MADRINSGYQFRQNDPWLSCTHDWRSTDEGSAHDTVRCVTCGAPGERDEKGDVYWPTT